MSDHVALNFLNNMSTAAVFFDMEEACDTAWYSDMLHKGKVVPMHYAMKEYGGGCIDPHFLDLGTSWR
jgi:hypothetical protein